MTFAEGVRETPEAPLSGVRVLDLGRMIAAPLCAWYLAGLGAEVLRVELPGGDSGWDLPPFVGPRGAHRGPRGSDDVSFSHLHRERGKRSLVIDYRTEAGRDLVLELCRNCNALIENYRPGVMASRGLGYEAVAEQNRALVYCSISGYGQYGPYRNRQGMDLLIQASSGMMSRTGESSGPPTKVGPTLCDQSAAVFAALGIAAAVRSSEITGHGRWLDVSLFDVAVAMLWDEPLDEYARVGFPERWGNQDPRSVPISTHRTRDGWITIVVTNDAQFSRLADLIGFHELATRFPTRDLRVGARVEIGQAIDRWASAVSTVEAERALLDLDIPAGAVKPADVAKDDAHVDARGTLVPLRLFDGTTTPYVGPTLPLDFAGRPDLEPTETLGASTAEVLRQYLDLTSDELEALSRDGIIGSPTGVPAPGW